MSAILKIYNTYLAPAVDNTIDLGTSTYEFKDLFLDGIAYIDTLNLHEATNFVFYENDLVAYDNDVVFVA